jgi:acyl-CoA dehydrogenase
MMADLCMMVYGGGLKRKESVSARLGDILSQLYLLSSILNRYHHDGSPEEDLPLVHWSAQICLYEAQQSFDEILRNFPFKSLAFILRLLVFPLGRNFARPTVRLGNQITQLFIAPTDTRKRLTSGLFMAPDDINPFYQLEVALLKTIQAEPIEKLIRKAVHDGVVTGYHFHEQAKMAMDKGVITSDQYDIFKQADEARQAIIAVDDFLPEELARA